MKSLLFAAAALSLLLAPARAANISSAGIDGEDGGLLKINQTDPYWWFCAQPDGSRGPLFAGPTGYNADVVTLDQGWTRQTVQRFSFLGGAQPAIQAELPLQVNVIEYVMDTYLPWNSTADRFLEKTAEVDQNEDDDFLNRFYAVHEYVKALYFKPYEDANPNGSGFQDLSIFNPVTPYSSPVPTSAEIARSNFFDQIKADVRTRDLNDFFVSYDPVHTYAMVNTFASQGTSADWQDAIVIVSAVPEPSVGVLSMGAILLLLSRRRA